jgi:hypothetical protein
MNFGRYGEWETESGVEFRATLQGDHHAKGHQPTGRAEIAAVAVLMAKFGGKDWRRIGQRRSPCADRVETSDTWQNEYGVEVEVRT